jgi:hypothetical protein
MVASESVPSRLKRVLTIVVVGLVSFAMGSAVALFPRGSDDGIYGLAYNALAALGPDVVEARVDYRKRHNQAALTVNAAYKVDSVSASHGETFVIERFSPRGGFEGEDFAESEYSIKPALYMNLIGSDILLTQGDGSFLVVPESGLSGDSTTFTSVPTNLDQLLPDGVRDFGWFSIKGVFHHEGQLYLSYSHDADSGPGECWSTALASAPFSTELLEFANVWVSDFCVNPADVEEFNGHQAGGALSVTGETLLLTHGDYRSRELSQDPNSFFGKLLGFDLSDLNAAPTILATGLRNAQSILVWDDEVWITDQGPRGGDELNLVSLDELVTGDVNFGWPISSYGEHYDGEFRPEAPLHKSHADYGFVEPARYWVPSIAVSSVTRSPFAVEGSPTLAVGALGSEVLEGDLSIHFLGAEARDGQVDTLSILPMGSRVRSLEAGASNVLYGTLDSGEFIRVTSQADQ